MKTPTQQALIQFIESIIITAIIAGIVSISSVVTGTGPLNWHEATLNFGLAVAFSLAHSVAAYLKAQPATSIDLVGLGAAIDALVSKVQNTQPATVQPAQTATTATALAVHGPSNVSTATTVQPSQDGAQTSIPAFTSTVEIPVVKVS
jgi:hypothetical protein